MTQATDTTEEQAAEHEVIRFLHENLAVKTGDTSQRAVQHLASLWRDHPEQISLSLEELADWIPQLSLQGIRLAWSVLLEQHDDAMAMAFLKLVNQHHLLHVAAISLAGGTGDTYASAEQRLRMLRLCLAWRQDAEGDQGVKILCEDVGSFLLHRAMRSTDTLPVVDLLLEHAAHDPCGGMGPENWVHTWVLGLAGQAENPGAGAVLERLLRWGAGLDAINEDGLTPLMMACNLHERLPGNTDFEDAIDWLVAFGADRRGVNAERWPRASQRILRHPMLVGNALGMVAATHHHQNEDGLERRL